MRGAALAGGTVNSKSSASFAVIRQDADAAPFSRRGLDAVRIRDTAATLYRIKQTRERLSSGEGQHGEEKEESRKHEHEIHQAHDRSIGHAAMIAGGGAEKDTDEGGDADRDEADGQRDA